MKYLLVIIVINGAVGQIQPAFKNEADCERARTAVLDATTGTRFRYTAACIPIIPNDQ